MFIAKDIHWSVRENEILRGMSMEIPTWQAIALVGPNWCGKTSFLNVINGFQLPTYGEIHLDKEELTSLSVEKRARKWVWRVFQNFGIFKELTVYENLALAYVHELTWWQKWQPVSSLPTQYKEEIHDMLDYLDIFGKRNDKAWNLSWGQMRLLEIARLALQKTKLYLLDEPTAWVAPILKGKVIELLKSLVDDGKIVIIVEHDFAFLRAFVDQIFVMEAWKIVEHGPYKQIKHSEKVKEIYFG